MRHSVRLFAALFGFAALSSSARAAVVIDITQQGSDVVATGSGTIDTSALTFFGDSSPPAFVDGGSADIIISTGAGTILSGASGPASFGSNTFSFASSSSGSMFGITDRNLNVPAGYISGSSLSGSDTFATTTIAGLGLTTGTYTYTWGTGPDADSLTVQIGAVAAVPESSTWALMLLGFAGVGIMAHRRKQNGPKLNVA